MTRRVNFSADQRVDLPEIQALQQFLTEDDRRFLRMCLLGRAQSENRVIRGFKVEPESPVSARVLVVHDLGAPGESAFVGAENLGGVFEHGALAGGIDGAGNLEGAAQLLLDFSAQPAATYDVKVRLTYTTGIADNRAFWNPSTKKEVVRQTDTRKLPQWQIAFQGHADPDWVLLASVVWNGVSIAAADITDKRRFAIEGMANPTGAAPWSHAAQDETTGVGDFPRSDTRDDPTVGAFGVWEALGALARQIQDLKGQREGDQRFDWYSRVFAPPGFRTGAVPKPDEYTKSLRSIDTVTFTVADGDTEGADFMGQYALVECFKFIQDNAAELPGRILVMVKDRQTTTHVYGWNQNIVIPDKHIGLIGVQGGTVSTATPTLFQVGEGQIAVGVQTTVDTVALKFTGSGGLYCENLMFYDDVEGGAQLSHIEVDPRGYFQARNVTIAVNAAPNEARPQLRCGSERLVLDQCRLSGAFFIGGRSATAFPINGENDNFHTGGSVQNSTITGLLRLRHKAAPVVGEQLLYAHGIRFERTTFVPTTLAAPVVFGQVDARGARQLTWHDCHFLYLGDQDCLRFGDMDLGGVFVASRDMRVTENIFKMQFSATHAGFVGGAGGVNGTEGTGWAIKSWPSSPVSVRTQICKGLNIAGNRFSPDESLAFIDTSPDAGCVALADAREVWLDKNDVREWTLPRNSVGDTQILFLVTASLTGGPVGGGQSTWIRGNYIGDWREAAVGQAWGAVGQFLNCLRIGPFANGVKVHGNVISAVAEDGTVIDPSGAHSAAVVFDSVDVEFEYNRFLLWRSATDPLDSTCVGIGGILLDVRFTDNNFVACGGANIHALAGIIIGLYVNNNHFLVGPTDTLFHSAVDLGIGATLIDNAHFKSNTWNYDSGGAVTKFALRLGPAIHFSVVGNYFPDGNIRHATAGGLPTAFSHGYAAGVPDLNFINAYT